MGQWRWQERFSSCLWQLRKSFCRPRSSLVLCPSLPGLLGSRDGVWVCHWRRSQRNWSEQRRWFPMIPVWICSFHLSRWSNEQLEPRCFSSRRTPKHVHSLPHPNQRRRKVSATIEEAKTYAHTFVKEISLKDFRTFPRYCLAAVLNSSRSFALSLLFLLLNKRTWTLISPPKIFWAVWKHNRQAVGLSNVPELAVDLPQHWNQRWVGVDSPEWIHEWRLHWVPRSVHCDPHRIFWREQLRRPWLRAPWAHHCWKWYRTEHHRRSWLLEEKQQLHHHRYPIEDSD